MSEVQRQIETLHLIRTVKLQLHLYVFDNSMLELWACRIPDKDLDADLIADEAFKEKEAAAKNCQRKMTWLEKFEAKRKARHERKYRDKAAQPGQAS